MVSKSRSRSRPRPKKVINNSVTTKSLSNTITITVSDQDYRNIKLFAEFEKKDIDTLVRNAVDDYLYKKKDAIINAVLTSGN